MRRGKKTSPDKPGLRPKLTLGGVACVMGVNRSTLYRRIQRGKVDLDGIPYEITDYGNCYDMEAVYESLFPHADRNTIAGMMNDFIQKNGRLIR